MTRGFVSGTWLTQSNWFPSDGALAGPCEALPAQENVSVGPNEPPPKSPGQTDGALSPADKGSTPQNSASSLRESDACEGGSSAPSVSSARRRARPTRFSAVQLQELERIFQEQRYIETGDRQRLSKVLNLTPVQIKTWFQNRRMRFKHQLLRAKAGALISNCCVPYDPCPKMSALQASPDLNYNVASHPADSVLQIHPALQSPAWLMPPSLPGLPPVRFNTDFKLSPAFAFPPYHFPDPGNDQIQDFGGLGYPLPPPHPFKGTQE